MANSNEDFAANAWIELALVPDVPLHAKLNYLSKWQSPRAVLSQSLESLKAVDPKAKPLAKQVPQESIDAVLDWITSGGHCVFVGDEDYPQMLMERMTDVPLAIFSRGDLGLLQQPIVSIIGAPKASARGKQRTQTLALELAQEGVIVAAGISPGISQAAHQGANSASASLGIVGSSEAWEGVRLAQDVAANGLLLSELPPRAGRSKGSYAWRHRLLAAVANVVVLVEAPKNCDSLELASIAADLGVEVAAVPADPDDDYAKGGNRLLREGSILIENASDVLALL